MNGERAYARARRGEVMDLPARSVTIHSLSLQHWDSEQGKLTLEVHCSAGTYIRSLARDLGQALGCGGCLDWLLPGCCSHYETEGGSNAHEPCNWLDNSFSYQAIPPPGIG